MKFNLNISIIILILFCVLDFYISYTITRIGDSKIIFDSKKQNNINTNNNNNLNNRIINTQQTNFVQSRNLIQTNNQPLALNSNTNNFLSPSVNNKNNLLYNQNYNLNNPPANYTSSQFNFKSISNNNPPSINNINDKNTPNNDNNCKLPELAETAVYSVFKTIQTANSTDLEIYTSCLLKIFHKKIYLNQIWKILTEKLNKNEKLVIEDFISFLSSIHENIIDKIIVLTPTKDESVVNEDKKLKYDHSYLCVDFIKYNIITKEYLVSKGIQEKIRQAMLPFIDLKYLHNLLLKPSKNFLSSYLSTYRDTNTAALLISKLNKPPVIDI